MSTLQEKLEAWAEREAKKRSLRQASTGCEHMDKAIQRLIRIGFEDCATQLMPLIEKMSGTLGFYADTAGYESDVEFCKTHQKDETVSLCINRAAHRLVEVGEFLDGKS